jgi:hypothetical protein
MANVSLLNVYCQGLLSGYSCQDRIDGRGEGGQHAITSPLNHDAILLLCNGF